MDMIKKLNTGVFQWCVVGHDYETQSPPEIRHQQDLGHGRQWGYSGYGYMYGAMYVGARKFCSRVTL